MELEPVITPVMDVVEQVAKEGGDTLLRVGGNRLATAAKNLFDKVLGRVKKEDPKAAERFPDNPEGYKAPVADTLKEAAQSDPTLVEELKALLEEYREAARAAGVSQNATVTGSGAAAQGQGSAAAGKKGVAVSGPVSGGISTGGGKPK